MKGNILVTLLLLAVGGFTGWTVWKSLNGDKGNSGGGSVVLMDFYADWCPPCRAMKPVVRELEKELEGRVDVQEINVETSSGLARKYNVRSIPCFVVLRDGREVARRTGAMPKEALRELVGE